MNLASPTRLLGKDEDLIHVAGLLGRHQRLYIGGEMVAAILELARRTKEDPGAAAAAFASRRELWEREGGFIDALSPADVSDWIKSDFHVVAEVSAPGSPGFLPVAQAVLTLPKGDWVVPLLTDPRDQVHDAAIHSRILAGGPRATALVDFLGVLPEWSHSRLAGSARHAALLEVIRINGTMLRENQVRQLVGLAFAVQKLEILDPAGRQEFGGVIDLAKLGQDEIVNRASLAAIGKSSRSPAHLLGLWRSAPPVKVCLEERRYLLHVHWHCFVRLIEEIEGANPY